MLIVVSNPAQQPKAGDGSIRFQYPSSATRRRERNNCNSSAMAGFAAPTAWEAEQ
jgi:hypothetical protein